MSDYVKYYLENLYPFQDGILNILKKLKTPFYLTGGTALSRIYFNHRFSDDLDFFVNSQKDFDIYCSLILEELYKCADELEYTFDSERIKKSDTYVRIYLIKSEIELKIDFVSDVNFRIDRPFFYENYGLVDTWKNILVNKVSALYRFEPKDIVDLWMLAKNFLFDWRIVFKYASRKDAGIDPQTVFEIITTIPKEYLKSLKWIQDVDIEDIYNDLKHIGNDIINGNINTLFSE
ncbi:conserved hypothetical protein [Deferribacter desulfuricans SSM1]|uniref:Nucleotidyl transferase AbiEii/AbiGii toxin family protein n=1 Tax=Deferribacter desulfuricans (strain DSM 14783 / JCM 11476 / NBRC 101012 / SSM1) TaxID=639282 RepID=D3P9S7_DEFDS|nr:nucleotidyl transferase AbiEii/AbiGii toxin family protein [Deferribacter desulfuricans]BAI81467.1 conserved hypothetical protein [Deferribacter desulfuricans SSM1]